MKVSLQQQANPTSTGTQDWTDSVFSSDVKGAVFFGSSAVANDTATANARLNLGASDGTNHVVHGIFAGQDAVDPNVTAASQRYDGSNCIQNHSGFSSTVKATISAILSNGVTVNYNQASATQYLFNGVIVGGSDIAFATTKTTKTASTTPITVTHGVGGTPDVIIVQSAIGATTDPQTLNSITILTFWERGGSTTSAMCWSNPQTSVNTDVGAYVTSANSGRWVTTPGPTLNATVSISNVGTTTFDLNYSPSPSNTWRINAWCLRGVSAQIIAKCGVFTTPTSTGNNSPITGMGKPPIWLITVPTRLTAETTLTTDDSGGSYGVGMAVNNASVTQQGSVAYSFQDNVSTTVAKSRTSNSQALMVLDNTGAAQTAATVNSWNSDGVTLNYGTASATAYKVAYLAIAAPAASATGGGAGMMMMGGG